MKKYFVLALAVLFVLSMTASAFAIHAEIPAETQAVIAKGASQITIGGELRFRGDFRHNTSDFNSSVQDDKAYYDMRIRLSVEAKVTPNTTGFVQLEGSGSNGTASGSADNSFWGAGQNGVQSGVSGSVQMGNQKQSSLYMLQAWILHQGTGLLGVPALIKVGHMPITVGTGLFYDHSYQGDDAALLGVDPIKGLHIIAAFVRDAQGGSTQNGNTATVFTVPGSTATSNNANAYALLVSYDINKDSNVGLDITYLDDQNNGTGGIQTGGFGVINGSSITGNDIHFWNLGVNGKTKIAGLGLYGEFDKQLGSALGDVKFSGWAGKAGANYTLAPVTVGAEFAIASGDNPRHNDNNINLFITSQGTVQHFTYVYDYRTKNAAGNLQGGLQNTWYLKASAASDITKAISAGLEVYYLRAVDPLSTTAGLDKKDIGWEVDAHGIYKIDRNLNYFVEGGYLFAGDFNRNFMSLTNGKTVNSHPDDAWVVRHGIQLAF